MIKNTEQEEEKSASRIYLEELKSKVNEDDLETIVVNGMVISYKKGRDPEEIKRKYLRKEW